MKVCPKCFESNAPEAEFCSECGAPFKDGAEGSDQEVYNDLARANLLRMRGDMKAANDVCLKILRRYPNNATAHTLLGDISADQNDLDQAATWYEMAIELNPESSADKAKLTSIQERIKNKQAAEAALQIGIPERGPRTGLFVAVVSLIVIAVGVGAFFAGKGMLAKSTATPTIETPVNVGQPEQTVPKSTTDEEKPKEEVAPPASGAIGSPTASDEALLAALRSKGKDKVEFLSVAEDPRSASAVLTVRTVAEELPNVTATKAGLDFFDVLPAFKHVTLRMVGETGFVLVADMTEEAAKTARAAIEGGDTFENQSQTALSQPWTPPHKSDESTTSGH